MKVNVQEPYEINFGIEDFYKFIDEQKPSKCVIITDSNVEKLYADKIKNKLRNAEVVSFEAGEENKNLETYKEIMEKIFALGLDRKSLIIALGGGVVGDVAGFVAGTYMRGLAYVQIPTTLLAMVDSSVGGKVAVDLDKCKNLMGLFYQPSAVFIDLDFLKTLPAEEIKNGLVEVIKYGVIKDSEFFSFLEGNLDKILNLDNEVLLKCIERSCEIKAEIVEEDETEQGLRMILNFGHTIGHAIEIFNEYSLKHGECVAEGMVKESEISDEMKFLDRDSLDRIKKIIKKINLEKPKYDSSIIELMKKDKKNTGGKVKFVLPKKIGEVFVTDEVPLEVVEGVL